MNEQLTTEEQILLWFENKESYEVSELTAKGETGSFTFTEVHLGCGGLVAKDQLSPVGSRNYFIGYKITDSGKTTLREIKKKIGAEVPKVAAEKKKK